MGLAPALAFESETGVAFARIDLMERRRELLDTEARHCEGVLLKTLIRIRNCAGIVSGVLIEGFGVLEQGCCRKQVKSPFG